VTYKSILCLNGDLPPRDFFQKLALPIVAADGAANRLHGLGIVPRVVIGDLDSVVPHLGVQLMRMEDQNQCDYEKSMTYLAKQGLLPTIVLGMGGGELDHVLNNVNVFMSGPSENIFYAPPVYGRVLNPSKHLLSLPLHTKVSIFGLPETRITTRGLQWDVTEQKLAFPGFVSLSNRVKAKGVILHVLEGQALFLAHGLFSLTRSEL
jgi:thiamine pyrophosphokinase